MDIAGLPGGEHSEDQNRCCRDQRRKQQHAPVDVRFERHIGPGESASERADDEMDGDQAQGEGCAESGHD